MTTETEFENEENSVATGKEIKIEPYIDWIQRIFDFNGVMCGNKHTFGKSRIDLQKKLTIEEIDETIAAISDNDTTEILDGAADVLVTGSYLYFLLQKIVPKETPVLEFTVLDSDQLSNQSILEVLDMVKHGVENDSLSVHPLQLLMVVVSEVHGRDNLFAFIEAVLSSNESKFIPIEDFDEESELEYMAEQYADTEYTNITPVERMFGDQTVICMKADDGIGKMLKPSCYKKPQYFLENHAVNV